jgi:indole-3-glycerol phosphate synthase
MNILEQIVAFKKQEIAKIKSEVSLEKLVKSPAFKRTPLSLKEALA